MGYSEYIPRHDYNYLTNCSVRSGTDVASMSSSHPRHPNSLLPSAVLGCGWGRAANFPAIASGARQNLQCVDSTPKTNVHNRRKNRFIILVERGFLFLVPSQVCLFSLLSKQRQDCHNNFRHLLETEITSPL